MIQAYRPAVLTVSGHDPTGGAGVQADIESLLLHQCHPCSVITCTTQQDTTNLSRLFPQPAESLQAQIRTLLADIDVKAIKIGLLGSRTIVRMLCGLIPEHATIPVILDPVLAAGGGKNLADPDLVGEIQECLVPHCKIMTPNTTEARRLSGNRRHIEDCANFLLSRGCEYVLVTDADEAGPRVTNRLFSQRGHTVDYTWERLPFSYHGSGCTLAAHIAGLIATGCPTVEAVARAQQMTWDNLQRGFQPGRGQHIPNRLGEPDSV